MLESVSFFNLQMILERRTNQGMLRLIQPKEGSCVSSSEKPSVKCDKGVKSQVAANSIRDGDDERKPKPEKTDETTHAPPCTGVGKTEAVNASIPPAAEKTSPLAGPGIGKLTYNPITHAPSMRVYFFGVKYETCLFV